MTMKINNLLFLCVLFVSLRYSFSVCSTKYGTITKKGRLDIEDAEEIEAHAFNGCDKLHTLFLSDSVRRIHEYAFANSHVQRVLGAEGLRTLENWSFANCSHLRLFDAPNVTRHEWYAFNNTYIRAFTAIPPTWYHMRVLDDGSVIV